MSLHKVMAVKKIIGLVVVLGLFGLSVLVWALTNNKVVIGYNKGYMPDQPLPFSHQLHAGQYQINCKFCHTSVENSRHASIPSLNICMNCHMVVKPESPWIQKLAEAYKGMGATAYVKSTVKTKQSAISTSKGTNAQAEPL